MIAACMRTKLSIGRLWLTEDEARHVGLLHLAEFRCADDVGEGETRADHVDRTAECLECRLMDLSLRFGCADADILEDNGAQTFAVARRIGGLRAKLFVSAGLWHDLLLYGLLHHRRLHILLWLLLLLYYWWWRCPLLLFGLTHDNVSRWGAETATAAWRCNWRWQ